MVFRTKLPFVSVFLLTSISFTFPGVPALSAGGWSHFVEQQLDVNDPNSRGVGGMLSESQKRELTTLEDVMNTLEDQVSQAINANQLTKEQAADLRSQIGKIEFRETDIVTKGSLSYGDAEGLLTDEQHVKATLKADLAGHSKPVATDYYNSKDPYEFRDHLIRKLYYYRLHGALSAGEYDELRSHVEHAGQKLDREGKNGAHDSKLLKHMRELETQINAMVAGASTGPPPVEKVKLDKVTAEILDAGNAASSGANLPLNQASSPGDSSSASPEVNAAINSVTNSVVDPMTTPVSDPAKELPNTLLNTLPANAPRPSVSGPLSVPDMPQNLNLNLNQAQ
jgi:hypothetical protein